MTNVESNTLFFGHRASSLFRYSSFALRYSLRAQCLNWIDQCGAASGQPTREQRDKCERSNCDGKSGNIERAHAVEQTA